MEDLLENEELVKQNEVIGRLEGRRCRAYNRLRKEEEDYTGCDRAPSVVAVTTVSGNRYYYCVDCIKLNIENLNWRPGSTFHFLTGELIKEW